MTEAGTAVAKSNHRVNVVRILEIKKHPNADKLAIYPIPGTDYQYIGPIGQFNVGDLAAYVQPDSVVPEKSEYAYLWEGRIFEGPVPERYRRIKAKKLRKEWSEGLLVPLSKGFHVGTVTPNGTWYVRDTEPISDFHQVQEGDNVADYLGVYHYEPPEPATLPGDCEKGPSYGRRWPHSFKGWFFFLLRKATFNYFDKYGTTDSGREIGPLNGLPVYDVEAYKNYKDIFSNNENVTITEKIHGSNFRAVFMDGKFYVGSRKLWKKATSGCVWRRAANQHPWIEEWCKANPGYTVYGEVVPTQDGYNYGCKPDETKVLVFDIHRPDGTWVSVNELRADVTKYAEPLLHWVPVIDERYFQENVAKSLADGPSKVPGATHRREGVVIRPHDERQVRHLGRVQLKIVSNEFLEKEK